MVALTSFARDACEQMKEETISASRDLVELKVPEDIA